MRILSDGRRRNLEKLADVNVALLQTKKERGDILEILKREEHENDHHAPATLSRLENLNERLLDLEEEFEMYESKIRRYERNRAPLQVEAEAQLGNGWSLLVAP